MKILRHTVAVLALAAGAEAQEASIRLESKVTGNQEQPKVMVIVPWQDVSGPEAQFDDFTPRAQSAGDILERETFQRELEYRSILQPSSGR